MSTGEPTEAAKRKIAHEHPDWADSHPSPHTAHKHLAAPTTQVSHYVVKVCNLTGLEAVCGHGGRKAAKEVKAPQLTGRAMKESTASKAESGMQEGTFVLSVIPHDDAPFTRRSVDHTQRSVGYQGSDPFHTADHENIKTAEAHEEAEKKDLEKELKVLHEREAGLRATGSRLRAEQTAIEQYGHKLEQRHQEITQKLSQSHANGNIGKHKTQQIHKQRHKLQQDEESHNRKKARNLQASADHAHRQSQSAKDLSHFQEKNVAHARFNLQMYTDHGPVTEVDEVKLTATMSQHCSAHPIWKVFEAHTHKLLACHNGMTLACNHLLPPVVDETLLSKIVPRLPNQPGVYWLRSLQPRTYEVQLHTCHATKKVLIHVYPQIKSGLVLTVNRQGGHLAAPDDSWLGRIEKYEQKFRQLFNFLKVWAPRVENLEVDVLAQGRLDLSNTWEEEAHTNEVVWKASVDADLDLIEASFRVPVVNIDPLPQAIKDRVGTFIDAGIYFTFDGKLAAGFAGAWTSTEGFRMEKGKIGGTFALGLEGLIAIGKNGSWGRMLADGTSTIFVGAEVHGEEKELSLELYWTFLHAFTADFAIFGPYDVELYHWQHDLWGPGPHNRLAALHLFGSGE